MRNINDYDLSDINSIYVMSSIKGRITFWARIIGLKKIAVRVSKKKFLFLRKNGIEIISKNTNTNTNTNKNVQVMKMSKIFFILEFLNGHYFSKEKYLERKIIDNMDRFLEILGEGFIFCGRQEHFVWEGTKHIIDLLFYNYESDCFLIIDLKIKAVSYRDLGQIICYTNYYDKYEISANTNNEKRTIGLVLCPSKRDGMVKNVLEDRANIFVAEYHFSIEDFQTSLKKKMEDAAALPKKIK